MVDRPNVGKQDDAKHATRLVRSILTEVLPYLNIFMTEPLSEAEVKELEDLDLEIVMEANRGQQTLSGNEIISSEDSVSDNELENQTENGDTPAITDPQGGDITSSITPEEGEGDTAPLTGVLINPETGEPVNNSGEDGSPY